MSWTCGDDNIALFPLDFYSQSALHTISTWSAGMLFLQICQHLQLCFQNKFQQSLLLNRHFSGASSITFTTHHGCNCTHTLVYRTKNSLNFGWTSTKIHDFVNEMSEYSPTKKVFVLFEKYYSHPYKVGVFYNWTLIQVKSETSNPYVPYIMGVWASISPEAKIKLFVPYIAHDFIIVSFFVKYGCLGTHDVRNGMYRMGGLQKSFFI